MKKYINKKMVIFNIDIKQKQHKNEKWKKDVTFPSRWTNFTLKNSFADFTHNGVAIMTGKINNLIIIDIDNVEHWDKLLKENNQTEPDTVKVISGSGGIHYYFKYDEELENITSKDHCFSREYDIDIKTNGGCIIAPPTKYFNKNLNKEVEYKWEKNIFDNDPSEVPKWIKNLLLKKMENPKKNEKATKPEQKNNICHCPNENLITELYNQQNESNEFDESIEYANKDFTEDEIEQLIKMLSKERAEGYNEWINVGMCLFNISQDYRLLWKKFSKKSNKYDEKENVEKWKSFKKSKDGFKIGSLLKWACDDNPVVYNEFIKQKNLTKMIIAKYPKDNLLLGNMIEVSNVCKYINVNNKNCLIKGGIHDDLNPSMYVEMMNGSMTMKCKHPECFGKIHCGHVSMTKQEVNFVFNGDIYNIVNINNTKDDELVEFQAIELFDDNELNELVYDGLTGKATELACIIYYYHKNEYNYGEDNEWYVFKDHRWHNIGAKNAKLRASIKLKLKEIYGKVYNYYLKNDKNSKKTNAVKQIINSLGDTMQKNNIITELIDLYLENNNEKRDFVSKFDSDQNLIGFNNGVYDLNIFDFRDGKQDDYVTMTTGYDYIDKHSKNYEKLEKFLEDIQPNKDERDYILTYISTSLFGNTLELFTVLVGNGRNGKSKLIELIEKTFGEYFGSIKSQILTSQIKDGDAPAPCILDLLHKKIVVASETLEGAKLNTGFIKFITGRDMATFRLCHQNDMIKFKAKFNTLLACNNIPECDNMDNAFSKRLRCINFPTEFVDNNPKENQKLKDENIDKYFDEWKQDFMLLLIKYYKKYKSNSKLIVTDNILKWTSQYKENTDTYLQFLNQCTEKKDTGKVFCVDLYAKFKSWFRENEPNNKMPSNREFCANLRKHVDLKEKLRIDNKIQLGIEGYCLLDL